MAVWSSGRIPVLGTGDLGFEPRLAPFFYFTDAVIDEDEVGDAGNAFIVF